MKASMYFNYTSRSLFRGGQRTILAVFCVAVGVMAIVSLQLVGQMINNAFTGNVRDANGGDIAVTSQRFGNRHQRHAQITGDVLHSRTQLILQLNSIGNAEQRPLEFLMPEQPLFARQPSRVARQRR